MLGIVWVVSGLLSFLMLLSLLAAHEELAAVMFLIGIVAGLFTLLSYVASKN